MDGEAKKLLLGEVPEATDADFYHEAVSRGRHPRSFPRVKGVWDLVHEADKRASNLNAGQSLHYVLDVKAQDIAALSKRAKLKNSPQQKSVTKEVKRIVCKPKTLSGENMSSLAGNYVSQCQDSHARKKVFSKRLSMYRNETTAFQAFTAQAQVGRSTNDLSQLSGKRLPNFQQQKVVKLKKLANHQPKTHLLKLQKKKKKNAGDVKRFLSDARQDGHHSRHKSVFKFLEMKRVQEEFESNSQKPNLVQEDSKMGAIQFLDKSLNLSSLPKKHTESIELLPLADSTKLFYGAQIVLEHQMGGFLTVSEHRGTFSVQKHSSSGELENADVSISNSESTRIAFTLIKLNDPSFVGPIFAGDDIWLCICAGPGQPTWKEGSLIGTRCTGGAAIDTVHLNKQDAQDVGSNSKKNEGAGVIVGCCSTVQAHIPHLPGSLGKAKSGMASILSSMGQGNRKNKPGMHLGRWQIKVAANTAVKGEERIPIANGMSIYLEQDLLYLSTSEISSHQTDVVLRTSPSLDTRGPYCIDYQGIFCIRQLQSNTPATDSKVTGEDLFIKARMQLKSSEGHRAGSKEYHAALKSGEKFPSQMRQMRKKTETKCEDLYFKPIVEMKPELKTYFYDRYNGLSPSDTQSRESDYSKRRSSIDSSSSESSSDSGSDEDTHEEGSLANVMMLKKLRQSNKYQEHLKSTKAKPRWYDTVFNLKNEDLYVKSLLEKKKRMETQRMMALHQETNILRSLSLARPDRSHQKISNVNSSPAFQKLNEQDEKIRALIASHHP